ncbi:SH3 domain-containing protein [Microbacterium sp. MM2322]|uniref:SH3 domain-containing protein n=1 Tax=Microbacterium sp. MM2322 TaxID=3157631 RepID=UPI0032D58A0C
MGDRRILLADHEPPERPPLQVGVGDRVDAGARDDEWPAFVFVTAAGGTGWVPARYIEDGVVVTAYDTTELRALAGDIVEVIVDDPESEWAWCRDARGAEGWIPHRALGVAG